jgi:hypothetical protein
MRKARHLFFAAFAVSVVAVPALAQQAGSSGYPAPCPASQVSKSDVDRAHTVFLSGKGFLDESNYDKAISYFKDAYSIDCSVHAILPIIATAYERKGDKAEAVNALQEYLKRAPNAPDREIVERRIANLKAQIAASQPASSSSGSAPGAQSGGAAPTTTATSATGAPGATAAPTASAEPSTTATATVPTATSGASETPRRGHSVAPWIVVGVGGAAAITGGILYGIGSGDVSTAEKTCLDHTKCNDANARNTGNSGRSLETAGVVVGGVGLAAVVGGLVWHFAEPTSSGAPTTGTRLTPVVAPGYAGVAAGGAF